MSKKVSELSRKGIFLKIFLRTRSLPSWLFQQKFPTIWKKKDIFSDKKTRNEIPEHVERSFHKVTWSFSPKARKVFVQCPNEFKEYRQATFSLKLILRTPRMHVWDTLRKIFHQIFSLTSKNKSKLEDSGLEFSKYFYIHVECNFDKPA